MAIPKKQVVCNEELKDCKAFLALTPKQRRFVLAYLKNYNATQAAASVGYSKKTAYSQGFELLKKPEIAAALTEVSEKITTKDIADAQEVREFLTRCMRGNITDIVKWNESGLAFGKSSEDIGEQSRIIKKVKVTERKGNDDITEVKTEIELHDPVRAAELLGKTHGIFIEKAELEHSGEISVKATVEFVKKK